MKKSCYLLKTKLFFPQNEHVWIINELEMIFRACNLLYFLVFNVNSERNKNIGIFCHRLCWPQQRIPVSTWWWQGVSESQPPPAWYAVTITYVRVLQKLLRA